MGDHDVSVSATDIEEIKNTLNEMRDTISGKGQEPGLVGRVSSLENDRIDPRVFERMALKMNIICWIGGIIATVLIVGIASSWRYDAEVARASAAMSQPSSLSNVFKIGPDEAIPRMGHSPAAYVNMRGERRTQLSAIDSIIKDHVKAHGPIKMPDGTTYPHMTPSFTRAPPTPTE